MKQTLEKCYKILLETLKNNCYNNICYNYIQMIFIGFHGVKV